RAPDPVNNPTIDYDAPERERAQAALPDPMPPIPEDAALRAFYVSPTTTNTFGIDPASVRVLGHRVIQFTLVVTSRRGVRNIGYDAIDCESGQFQMLAIGRDGEGWSPVRNPQWRALRTGDTVNDQYRELSRSWCDGGAAAGEPRELLRRLDAVPERYLNNR
ncbi:MAG: CNP1-like family protein, partial [Gammaproteobacteria bacterium]